MNQSSRVGQTAEFAVVAIGTAPLTYQWSENGAQIAGATSSEYNTAILAPGDNGSTFSVRVSSPTNSVTSSSALLTVGPRAPQAGDLRFQEVDAASTSTGLSTGGVQSDITGGQAQNIPESVGTPLTIGSDCIGEGNPLNCTWLFLSFPLPAGLQGLTTTYQSSEVFGNLSSDLNNLSVPNTVITSLDLEWSNNAYAIASLQGDQASGYSFVRQSIPFAQVQASASLLGTQSQVITAISFDSCGDVYLLAYAWQSDPTTVYESKVVLTTLDNVGSEATSLATAGYIITALGGDPAQGFLLVGTRVQGDTMPRPIIVIVPNTFADLTPLFQSGDAVVGYLVNSAGAGNSTWIGEQ
jgi:hypothetical protein